MVTSNHRSRTRGKESVRRSIVPAAFGAVALLSACGGSFDATVDAEAIDAADVAPGIPPIYVAIPPDTGLADGMTVDATLVGDANQTGMDAGQDGDASEDAGVTDAAGASDGADVSEDAGAIQDLFVCDPSGEPKDEPCVIADAYGVFVAGPLGGDGGVDAAIEAGPDAAADAGADAMPSLGDDRGSMANPVPTIGQGLALAAATGKSRVYVCNGKYTEGVSITSAVSLYGGLSCAPGIGGREWSYAGGLAQINVTSPAYALTVTAVPSLVVIENMAFSSRDTNAQDPSGTSSIAALITSSTVSLRGVSLRSGSGSAGADGTDGASNPNYSSDSPSAPNGAPSHDADIVGTPALGGVNTCSTYGTSAGGNGGGGCAYSLMGTAGTATPPAPPMVGRDGLPYGTILPDGGAVLSLDPGADGASGRGGLAAGTWGTLSPSGWLPSHGSDGDPGNPGQGGAGANSVGACGISDITGGGGGGAGGCGGSAGGGGKGGGASIAFIGLNSAIDLQSCTLITGAGGAGGKGGAGQGGQGGGISTPSPYEEYSNVGAPGGNGAGGSGGGGGTAGVSLAGVSVGTQLTYDSETLDNVSLGSWGAAGAPGAGGAHGTAALTTGVDGAPGSQGLSPPTMPLGPFLSLM